MKRLFAGVSHVSLLPVFGNVEHHQRQLPRMPRCQRLSPTTPPQPQPGIDQNVYTYARFSFNNSSNALSAHTQKKTLTLDVCVCQCVCVWERGEQGRGRDKAKACANFDNAARQCRHLQRRRRHLCVAASNGISIIGKTG